MALRPTIHKAELDISDLDRQYYATHNLTIAQHPSENDARMMVRLLAFALCAEESLEFAGGLSESDEPDLWAKDLTGEISLWVQVGQPDARIVRKASRIAERILVLGYGRSVTPWWKKAQADLEGLANLRVLSIAEAEASALAPLAQRNMKFHVLIQDEAVTFGTDEASVAIAPEQLQGSPDPFGSC